MRAHCNTGADRPLRGERGLYHSRGGGGYFRPKRENWGGPGKTTKMFFRYINFVFKVGFVPGPGGGKVFFVPLSFRQYIVGPFRKPFSPLKAGLNGDKTTRDIPPIPY